MQDEIAKTSQLPRIPPWISVSCCLVLSMMYVASLYIWNSKHDRNHPSTVKRRFCSVFVVMLIAPLFVYLFSTKELLERNSLAQLLGLRLQGILAATTVPLALTALLFLGPISVHVHNGSIFAIFETDFWRSCFTNILWIRNLIVAPLSEEFVFRACMMPLVLQSFPPLVAIIVTPLFFGTAHIHHIAERLSVGMELSLAIAISCIQLTYTTLFGFYSAFLFVRTGHFVAPFVVHAFCNHMGFPDLGDLSKHCVVKRITFRCCCVLGFIGWILLLPIATDPQLYGNSQTWTLQESK